MTLKIGCHTEPFGNTGQTHILKRIMRIPGLNCGWADLRLITPLGQLIITIYIITFHLNSQHLNKSLKRTSKTLQILNNQVSAII